jgi:hypothetical protein
VGVQVGIQVVGEAVGCAEFVGPLDGRAEGSDEGNTLGASFALRLGSIDGLAEGVFDGLLDGRADGWKESPTLGVSLVVGLGLMEGSAEGVFDGLLDGRSEGFDEGATLGLISGITAMFTELLCLPTLLGALSFLRCLLLWRLLGPTKQLDGGHQNEVSSCYLSFGHHLDYFSCRCNCFCFDTNSAILGASFVCRIFRLRHVSHVD